MNKLISVIVPVYKVEKYIDRCINSIINQTYKNLEIILVDDGSPDNCPRIIDDYSQKDSRIKVIHKENGGLSSARNAGIEIATGDYIGFVDSDDYIRNDYFEILLENIMVTDADLSICRNKKFCENDEVFTEKLINIEAVYNKKQLLYELYKAPGVHECAWGKLYAKKIFDTIKFPVGRIYEDSSIMHEVYMNVNKAVFTNNELYFYLVDRNDSLMSSKYDIKKQNDNYLWLMERYEYLTKNVPEMKNVIGVGHIRNSITLLERTYTSNNYEIRNTDILKKLEEHIKFVLNDVDKNVLFDILDNYKLACLFLYLQDKEIYEKEIEALKKSR